MIEKIRKIRDSKGVFAYFDCIFDCISHELLLPKLQACGFEKISLILLLESTGELMNILFGVSQATILGQLLFRIYISDFFILSNRLKFESYTDDTTPFV